MTIIKTENGNVFGGYAEVKWSSTAGYMTDPNSFLFSLINGANQPFKSMLIANGFKTGRGPTFGVDLSISSNSNFNLLSTTNLGQSYKKPEDQPSTILPIPIRRRPLLPQTSCSVSTSILVGSSNFKTIEI